MLRAWIIALSATLALSARAATFDGSFAGSTVVQIVQATSASTVTATGSSTPRTLADRASDVVSVKDFGAKCDWTGVGTGTDDTTAINAANAYLLARGGGELRFPNAKCLVAGHVTLPTDGTTLAGGEGPFQRQPNIVWRGQGDVRNGFQQAPSAAYGGSMLVMTYNGTGAAKVETYGAGLFTMTGLTLYDPSAATSALPFLLTTNTTLRIYDNAFVGSRSGTAANQDAIILGGQDQLPATVNDPNMAFHGFGTQIRGNQFSNLRRIIVANQWVASLVIDGNWNDHTCGTNLAGADGAIIQFKPNQASSTGASSIVNNRFNMNGGYAYAVSLANTNYVTVSGNDVEDVLSPNNAAILYCDAASTGNLIITTLSPSPMVPLVDASGTNVAISAQPTDGAPVSFPLGTQDFNHLKAHSGIYSWNAGYATSTTVANAPGINWDSQFWNGSASALDRWQIYPQLTAGTNGATDLYVGHPTGSSGTHTLHLETAQYVSFGSSSQFDGTTGSLTLGSSSANNLNGSTYFNGGNTIFRPATYATAGANVNGPLWQMWSRYWNGSASADDKWALAATVGGTGASANSTLTVSHTGAPNGAYMNLSALVLPMTLAPTAFASLGALANGTITYCSDCTVANPCAGGGTGAIAKRLNGAWVCN